FVEVKQLHVDPGRRALVDPKRSHDFRASSHRVAIARSAGRVNQRRSSIAPTKSTYSRTFADVLPRPDGMTAKSGYCSPDQSGSRGLSAPAFSKCRADTSKGNATPQPATAASVMPMPSRTTIRTGTDTVMRSGPFVNVHSAFEASS